MDILYGEKWLFCMTLGQIFILGILVVHVSVVNLTLLQGKGRSDLDLKLEFVKKTVSVGMVIYAATISVEAICCTVAIYTHICLFFNSYFTKRLIGLNIWTQLKDFLPYPIIAGLCTVPAFAITYLEWNKFLQLAVGGMSSLLLYIGFMKWRKDSALQSFIEVLEEKGVLRHCRRLMFFWQRS